MYFSINILGFTFTLSVSGGWTKKQAKKRRCYEQEDDE